MDETLSCPCKMYHVVRALAALMKLEIVVAEIVVADVTGAFLHWLPIQRELYFRLPRNLGKRSIPGVITGSLPLKEEHLRHQRRCPCTVPIQSCHVSGEGVGGPRFETAGFAMGDATNDIIALTSSASTTS